MFKLIALTALSLIMTQQALADLHCTGQNKETLVIDHQWEAEGTPQAEGPVTVLLNGAQISAGSYSEATGYVLTDNQSQVVDLKISQVPSYGGRCGRCVGGGITSWTTYAKLTLPQSEPITFTCN